MIDDREIIGHMSNAVKNIVVVSREMINKILEIFGREDYGETYSYDEAVIRMSDPRKHIVRPATPTPTPYAETLIKCECGSTVHPRAYNPSLCSNCIQKTINRLRDDWYE